MNTQDVIGQLVSIVGDRNVLSDPTELTTYECDGFPIAKGMPVAVVFPTSTDQVVACVRLIGDAGLQLISRGSGTGLAGGCVAFADGVIVSTSRMNQVVSVDIENRTAVVEAGVRNLELSEYVSQIPGGERLHFAPDPSSQRASTVGGNAATNAGGIHTLKHGVTSNHVLGMEVVLPDGSLTNIRCGGVHEGMGPDLAGLVCGSEGTFGLITRVCVKLTPKARSFRTIVGIYDDSRKASQSVAQIIGAGVIPAAMEMMDGKMIEVVEDTFHYGFPRDARALLLIEIDGIEAVLDEQMEQVAGICEQTGARSVECSADPVKRAELWSARKRTFGAIGRISPSYCTQDACVPRSMLPDVIDRISSIGTKYGMTITNVFHAGDGNVHPILLFDEDNPEEVNNTMLASHEILEYCISIGGTLTGEHGVGVEKLPMMKIMFNEATMDTFGRLKSAFDPDDQCNAGKLIPSKKIDVDLLKPMHVGVPGGAM